eukprot:617492-Alexandrium_andersonii.AAC.1
MLKAPWLLSTQDGAHTMVPLHIEQALDDARGERRLIAHWNGLLAGTGEAWCTGPGSAVFTDPHHGQVRIGDPTYLVADLVRNPYQTFRVGPSSSAARQKAAQSAGN